MYIFRWHPLTFIASNCFTLGNYDNSHGIWWLFKIQSCREKEALSRTRIGVASVKFFPPRALKPLETCQKCCVLILCFDKKVPPFAWLLPICKVSAHPFPPFWPQEGLVSESSFWIEFIWLVVVVHCILDHPSLELVIKHRRFQL